MAATALSTEDAERLRSFERRVHDAVSTGYYDFFTPVTLLASEPLLDAVGLTSGMRLLDVASGPGSVAAAALRRGARPVGVDLSPRMVELARRLNPAIEFHEADVEHLPFPGQSFDALVCSFGLGHFPFPEAAVAECLRVVKAGGRLAFSWWDEPSRQRVQGLFRDAIAEVGAAPVPDLPARHSMLRFCDPAALASLLREAGLSDGHRALHRSCWSRITGRKREGATRKQKQSSHSISVTHDSHSSRSKSHRQRRHLTSIRPCGEKMNAD